MLELWGGIECTVNRVGDQYFDQIVKTGHQGRLDDLNRFADLGIQTLRYPVLWERVVPHDPNEPDWRWSDERLRCLRELGIRPIVGLCHHGSGPRWTGLLDPRFPEHLADYARRVAERYPWVDAFTPINEPLTTARFAALYGHWHPHKTDARSMARALVHECRAVQLAMRAIRQVNPSAQLVQTEDLGRVWSTPPLHYQADYENQRRWLSLDLLFGRVDTAHPLWKHLLWLGLTHDDLAPFIAEPCPPDIVGVNYYATSERFLDHRLDRYPAGTHGGNGRDTYADVEAVRVLANGISGPGSLVKKAAERYGCPVAITEAHLGATPDQQVRWLSHVWQQAKDLSLNGTDLRAVTVWALLGSWDWHCLVVYEGGCYEPGVFDIRFPTLQPTPLARLTKALATGKSGTDHPASRVGWWERPERLLYPPVDSQGNDVGGDGIAKLRRPTFARRRADDQG
ncbi:MAG: family 1 glycosylhydrolase [Chloroflexota bacterium]|nr:family 1 glycosylhydrolase [Chloroflexota bacterium]